MTAQLWPTGGGGEGRKGRKGGGREGGRERGVGEGINVKYRGRRTMNKIQPEHCSTAPAQELYSILCVVGPWEAGSIDIFIQSWNF